MTLDSVFAHPSLLAGSALVLAPLLIHFLFRLRRRTIRWAAMDFLLASNRSARRRNRFEQLLHLLLRCLLIVGAAALVARPIAGESWSAALGARPRSEQTVLIDDSYSMGERQGAADAFTAAISYVRRLADRLAEQPNRHTLSIRRTSAADAPLLRPTAMTIESAVPLRGELEALRPTFGAHGLEAALQAAEKSFSEGGGQRRVLHLVSDFRRRNWPAETDVVASMRRLSSAGVQVRLVDVATDPSPRANLGVEKASTGEGAIVASVPFSVEATIRNFSSQPVEQVVVGAHLDGKPLPTHTITKIDAGGSAEQRFTLQIDAAGIHEFYIELQGDSLPVDDRRYLALEVLPQLPVLLIDGDPRRLEARILALALAPGGSIRTGVAPVIGGPEALADASIDKYRSIWLLNAAELDEAAAKALTKFVGAGGGLAIWLGDRVEPAKYNRILLPAGLLAAELQTSRLSTRTAGDASADLRPLSHPVFKVFAGRRNSFLEAVRIERYYTIKPAPELPSRVIAHLRDGSPVAFESTLGKGRIILFLTSVGPAWNNWPLNPSYVVAMLELQRFLSQPALAESELQVGATWPVSFAPSAFRSSVVWTTPQPSGGPVSQTLEATPRGAELAIDLTGLEFPGVYRLTRTTPDGRQATVARAVNVESSEGDLTKIAPERLAALLQGVKYSLDSTQAESAAEDSSRWEPRDFLLVALLVLLFCEQEMAHRLSRHRRKGSSKGATSDLRDNF